METTDRKPGFFARLCKGLAHPVTTFIFGVALPFAAVSIEICTGMCSEAFSNPLTGNVAMQLAMSLVPVCNFIVWLSCLKGWGVGSRCLRALCGLSFGIAVVYAVAFLPLAVVGAIFCCVAFWYFGVGLLGILPSAPLFAALAALGFRRKLNRLREDAGGAAVKGFAWGLSAAAIMWLALLAVHIVMAYGVSLAARDDAAESAKGVRILRALANEDAVWDLLHHYGSRGNLLAPLAFFAWDHEQISMEKRRLIFYRVTGQDTDVQDWWRRGARRRRFLSWDAFAGGEKMGGVLEGLSLKGSSYTTVVDEPGCAGYAEWTLVFSNERNWNQEARARVALPHGAVVSRLTLWINGEEHEAAFGTRGQVRRAYEQVVSRNRDPVLVNVCGPDQVQVQCFPVPPKGEMKLRLGITVPLKPSVDGKTALLPAPAITAHNFSIPGDLLGMPSDETKALSAPPAPVAVCADDKLLSALPVVGRAIMQRASLAPAWKPKRVAVVIDASASMDDFFKKDAARSLAALPADVPVDLWLVGDVAPSAPAVSSPAGDAGRAAAFEKALVGQDRVGGRCNLVALVKAFESLARSGESSALVWIHGAQPVVSQTADVLSAKIAAAANVRVFLCQISSGTCEITGALAPSLSISSCSAAAINNGAAGTLEGLFSGWGAQGWQITRANVARGEVPADAAQAGRHLGRLWAAEETLRTYKVGDPVSLEKAQKFALPWQIVTPVTGAVVLETAEQYKANNLKPADSESVPTTTSSSVPSVPEPGTVCCLMLAALAVAFVAVRRARNVRRA